MSLGSKPARYQQFVAPDVQGIRSQQIKFLQDLLGPGGGANSGAFGQGGFFGGPSGLGSQATPLQRQATGGISQFLNQPAPEQRAFDTSMPALQGILNGAPGQGIMDALRPQFDRNLASANQQGGRFGSANAILRSRAVDDYNLLGAQAAQQGQQTQLQAAQVLGLLGNNAGQNPFSRLMGASQVGQADAQQGDLETQRRVQLLMALLGSAQGLAFNQPIVQTNPAQQSGWGTFFGSLLANGGLDAIGKTAKVVGGSGSVGM